MGFHGSNNRLHTQPARLDAQRLNCIILPGPCPACGCFGRGPCPSAPTLLVDNNPVVPRTTPSQAPQTPQAPHLALAEAAVLHAGLDGGLGGGQARDGHAQGRAGHVVHQGRHKLDAASKRGRGEGQCEGMCEHEWLHKVPQRAQGQSASMRHARGTRGLRPQQLPHARRS